jgi:hypothetical protein
MWRSGYLQMMSFLYRYGLSCHAKNVARLKNLKQLLLTNIIETQRFIDQERQGSSPPEAQTHLVPDFQAVVENVRLYEEATALQARIQTSDTAAEEARNTYKQARSIERYVPAHTPYHLDIRLILPESQDLPENSSP